MFRWICAGIWVSCPDGLNADLLMFHDKHMSVVLTYLLSEQISVFWGVALGDASPNALGQAPNTLVARAGPPQRAKHRPWVMDADANHSVFLSKITR